MDGQLGVVKCIVLTFQRGIRKEVPVGAPLHLRKCKAMNGRLVADVTKARIGSR